MKNSILFSSLSILASLVAVVPNAYADTASVESKAPAALEEKTDKIAPDKITVDTRDEHRHLKLLYTCNLSFHASGKSVYIGVGYTDMYGKGILSCYNYRNGASEDIPVRVTARGPGAGLGVTGLAISGGATGIGITTGPESLLGHYGVLRAGAAIGTGVAGGLGLRLSNGAATIDATIQAEGGLGAGVDLLYVSIEAESLKAPAAPSEILKEAPKATKEPLKETFKQELGAKSDAAPVVSAVPVKVVYVSDNQPVQIIDSQGKLLQIIYLKKQSTKN